MSTLEAVEQAVERLSPNEFEEFLCWFSRHAGSKLGQLNSPRRTSAQELAERQDENVQSGDAMPFDGIDLSRWPAAAREKAEAIILLLACPAMAGRYYTLVESALFSWETSRLGSIREIDEVLMNAVWAIARLADDLPFVENSKVIRHMPWGPVLTDDGTPIQLVIYFVVADSDTVELLSIREEAY